MNSKKMVGFLCLTAAIGGCLGSVEDGSTEADEGAQAEESTSMNVTPGERISELDPDFYPADEDSDKPAVKIGNRHLRLHEVEDAFRDGDIIESYLPSVSGAYRNYALRSLCVRAKPGEITTLKGKFVPFNANGTIDETQSVWLRGGRLPNHATERCVDVGRGNVVVGLSGRIKGGDVTHLQLYYRKWDSSRMQLTGTRQIKPSATQRGVLEDGWMFVDDIITDETMISRTFITRIGVREYGENLQNIYLETRTPCRDPETNRCVTSRW